MPLLKKLVLTGAAVAAVITFLAVWQGLQYGKRQELRRQAELTLGVAKDLYDKASQAETFAEKKAFYGQALEKYRAVIRDYGQQELARRAMVKGYICRAHLALIERNWQETDQYVVRADEVLKEVERSGGEVKDWVRDVQRELSDFRDYWDGQRVYEEGLEEARKAMEAGKLRTADKILLEKAGPAAATREQFAKVEGFRKEISEKEKQEAYWQLVQRGEEQAAEGDVAGATACYDQAIKVLEDGRKTLDLKIYTDLKRTAETKKNALLARTRYQAALKAARRQDKKDPLEAAKAYREAVAVFESFRGKLPPDEQKQLLAIADPAVLADTARDLEHDYWLEQGKGHLAAGRIRDAQRDLEKARQIKDSSAVRAELAKIQESKDCAALVFAGDRLFRDKNYAAALEKYQQALKFESASRAELSGKVTDCQYQLELTAAQGHMAKSEWDQAKAALLRAKRIKPANSPQVDAMLDQLGRDRDFIRLMAEAQKAREMGKYGDAIARLTEAKKIRPESTELDRLMRTVRYEHYLAVGRVAMEQKEYAGALGYFKLARGFMNTEEIEKLIQQAENGLKVEGGG